MLLSGSLPMSSAVTDSTTVSDDFFFAVALRNAARKPVMMIAFVAAAGWLAGVAAGCAAAAAAAVAASVVAGSGSAAKAGLVAITSASGLTAAANRQRELVLVIDVFPLDPGPYGPGHQTSEGVNPLPTLGISEPVQSVSGVSRYTYVSKSLESHTDDAEAADLVRHRGAGGGFAADRFARTVGQSRGKRGNAQTRGRSRRAASLHRRQERFGPAPAADP